ncbi:MAG: pyridoxal phosphate-dependent aminotransferase [Planktothrix rubescens PR222]
MEIASRLLQVNSSLTLSVDAKAKSMKTAGVDICSFSAGEPDFDTPEHIKVGAKIALDRGKTKYGATEGLTQLRQLIATKLKNDNNLSYETDQILVTNGAKHSLYNVMMALLNDGDEVVIPVPYWVSYPEMIKLAGGKPIFITASESNNYKITPSQLEAAITERTKLFIFNSPSNPTGIVYTPEEICALAEVIISSPKIIIISDEIYEKIIYKNVQHLSIASVSSEIRARTVVINGFSKAYAMTGWRIGYLAASPEIVKAVTTIQSHSTSNVCTFAQYGAISALSESQEWMEKMRCTFDERCELMYRLLSEIPGITCMKPDGAFYLFPNISGLGMTSIHFCESLLEEAQVAVIPGDAFGVSTNVRLSYATDITTIKIGCERIRNFVVKVLENR